MVLVALCSRCLSHRRLAARGSFRGFRGLGERGVWAEFRGEGEFELDSVVNILEMDFHGHCMFFPLESFIYTYVICKCRCIFAHAVSWSDPPAPICRKCLPALEVSGEFACNNAFYKVHPQWCSDLRGCSIHSTRGDFPWFGNMSQKTVCLVFGNIAFREAFFVDIVQPSPVLFC